MWEETVWDGISMRLADMEAEWIALMVGSHISRNTSLKE